MTEILERQKEIIKLNKQINVIVFKTAAGNNSDVEEWAEVNIHNDETKTSIKNT